MELKKYHRYSEQKKYLDPTYGPDSYFDISSRLESFYSKQTRESINFARFCGIEVNQIPCMVFFSSLENPKEYLIWSLKNQNAVAIIKDFRDIISIIDSEYVEFTDLKKRQRDLVSQYHSNNGRLKY